MEDGAVHTLFQALAPYQQAPAAAPQGYGLAYGGLHLCGGAVLCV